MTQDRGTLGGRIALLDPEDLSASARKTYDFIDERFVPWAEAASFQIKADDGRLIGPFNAALYSPEMCASFLDWQLAEAKHTTLDARVREIIILAVGAVWKADYELYAHAAVARKVGLSDDAISQICAGEPADDLSNAERIARQYATQLTAQRCVEDTLFAEAEAIFGTRGLVDIANLVGAYQTVCGILNSFSIPRPR